MDSSHLFILGRDVNGLDRGALGGELLFERIVLGHEPIGLREEIVSHGSQLRLELIDQAGAEELGKESADLFSDHCFLIQFEIQIHTAHNTPTIAPTSARKPARCKSFSLTFD